MEDILIPIFGIVGVFGMPVLVSCGLLHYFESRSEKKFHQTLQELIKSGQELSPDILQSIPGYKKEKENGKRNDIRTGTITSGVGIGIALFGQFGVSRDSTCRNWATGALNWFGISCLWYLQQR